MKVIIAGSRTIRDIKLRQIIKESGFDITEIVSGDCRGIDHLGELYAEVEDIPIKKFPADWTKHGKAAGPIRNQTMADYADALILIWDGESRGSFDMLTKAFKKGLSIFVKTVRRSDG